MRLAITTVFILHQFILYKVFYIKYVFFNKSFLNLNPNLNLGVQRATRVAAGTPPTKIELFTLHTVDKKNLEAIFAI